MTKNTEARRVAREHLDGDRRGSTLDERARGLRAAWALVLSHVEQVDPDTDDGRRLRVAIGEVDRAAFDHWTTDHATRIIGVDYRDDVAGLAECIAERVASGDIDNREALDEALHEACDGSQRVIYTYQAKLGLLASDHEDACEDETGEPPASPEVGMYWALRADVDDELSDLLSLDSDAWEVEA